LYDLEILQDPYASEDLEAIRAINQENIPEVSDIESIERLRQLIEWSSHLIIVRGSEIAGFIILMQENQDYESLNYDFFNKKGEPFLYVDRVAIQENYQRKGLGKLIYNKVIEIGKKLDVNITCEVNTIPRNTPSLAFHAGFGFEEVGTKNYGDHSVVYLTKFLRS
tara:strand:- start:836 stop:1333 length:498 start_codon:yes stop_codon:yes gene_type:complete